MALNCGFVVALNCGFDAGFPSLSLRSFCLSFDKDMGFRRGGAVDVFGYSPDCLQSVDACDTAASIAPVCVLRDARIDSLFTVRGAGHF